ncbi:MAG TPA: DNA mismatch repair protein MutS [Firmicutes bacterium]|nr:DNA mismatch repair protein MutS [Bacillota bacterium]
MALSQMMQQYLEVKDKYKDALIFYRLGDFYEMFFDDAVTASKELDLTLTGRDCGLSERAPMCGVPYHAVDTYIAKLLAKGYKVVICEQMTKPGDQKGLVVRKVVREVTPGTRIDSVMLDGDKNNYLMSAYLSDDGKAGVSWTDISTGEFQNLLIDSQLNLKLNEILSRVSPAEIICNSKMKVRSNQLSLVRYGGIYKFSQYSDDAFSYDNAFEKVKAVLKNFSMFDGKPECVCSAGALLDYIEKTQKRTLKHIKSGEFDDAEQYMTIDANARRTLELMSSSGGKTSGSLIKIIDNTSTSMGARMLKKWLEKPSLDIGEINRRLDAVQQINKNIILRDDIMSSMRGIYDLERIAGRASYGNISPRDCVQLCGSLSALRLTKQKLADVDNETIRKKKSAIPDFDYLEKLLSSAVNDNPSAVVREGGVIRDGFDKELDEYRLIKQNAHAILDKIESKEKAATGIKNLKIAYNRNFGYYIEVPKSQINLVPYSYVRRQTTVNAERYTSEELKDVESKILNAEDNAKAREVALYEKIVAEIVRFLDDLLSASKLMAYIDCLFSAAFTATKCNFTRPVVRDDFDCIKIADGRHPMVEETLKGEQFVPNDTFLDNDENRMMLITGPNMAGKSVYMRQVAIIVILAHMGYFVPARKAEICLVDKIFTRVGASDDLSTGRSTFMVEMTEVADILQNATDKSLLLMDEIGRGTSTYDGLSIAWAIIDYLSNTLKAKTLFSTHYHELTELEGKYSGIKNYKMTVRELAGSIVFVRKLLRGSANRSFGIEVASLAGLPDNIIVKAKEILKKLEKSDIVGKEKQRADANYQMSIFSSNVGTEIVKILKDIDVDSVSPRAALDILSDLKEKASDE